MRFLLLSLVVLSCALAAVALSNDRHWKLFKRQHGKTYAGDEDRTRKALFLETKRQVEHHNANFAAKLGYEMGLNHLSDWTSDELAKLNGFRMSAAQMAEASKYTIGGDHPLAEQVYGDNVPDQVDWREVRGRVSGVKDQGKCGSCWAFATTGVLEGQEMNVNATLLGLGVPDLVVPLSEQNLLDCSVHNYGCNGGSMTLALQDIAEEQGIEDETDYPYEAREGDCRFFQSKSIFSDKGFAIIKNAEEGLKQAVAKFGPVAVAINANGLIKYKSGIYKDNGCLPDPNTLNHGVLVVGYGTDPKEGDYWIIKNSWSTKWGEKGYFRMARNNNNQCGIGLIPTIPTF